MMMDEMKDDGKAEQVLAKTSEEDANARTKRKVFAHFGFRAPSLNNTTYLNRSISQLCLARVCHHHSK
jgi:hypothetical protein